MIRFPIGPSFRCSPRHPNSTKVDFSWKILRRRISSNGMIRYYCPSPKIRKPQSAFPIRFFIGGKHFDLSNVRRNSKPDKILNGRTRKKPFSSIRRSEYDPFIARLPKSCPKGLKQAKKGEIGPNFSCSKIAAAPLAYKAFLLAAPAVRPSKPLSYGTQKSHRSRNRRSALIRMRSSVKSIKRPPENSGGLTTVSYNSTTASARTSTGIPYGTARRPSSPAATL